MMKMEEISETWVSNPPLTRLAAQKDFSTVAMKASNLYIHTWDLYKEHKLIQEGTPT
jgi:hypothetical protein